MKILKNVTFEQIGKDIKNGASNLYKDTKDNIVDKYQDVKDNVVSDVKDFIHDPVGETEKGINNVGKEIVNDYNKIKDNPLETIATGGLNILSGDGTLKDEAIKTGKFVTAPIRLVGRLATEVVVGAIDKVKYLLIDAPKQKAEEEELKLETERIKHRTKNRENLNKILKNPNSLEAGSNISDPLQLTGKTSLNLKSNLNNPTSIANSDTGLRQTMDRGLKGATSTINNKANLYVQ
jgi:hypothetical protein